eukprot:12926591-Prorocentrum_lima.AAC.1
MDRGAPTALADHEGCVGMSDVRGGIGRKEATGKEAEEGESGCEVGRHPHELPFLPISGHPLSCS